MSGKLVIFDFDGTIADTLEQTLEVINSLGPEFKYESIGKDEVQAFRDKGARELFKLLKVSKIKLPFFVMKIKKTLNNTILEAKPFPGIKPVLAKLKDNNITLGLLSSNSQANIKSFLNNYDLNFFDFINGDSSVFGKAQILKRIVKSHGFDHSQVFYVGDEDRDTIAAKESGLKSIAVTWGFNSKKLLSSAKPDYIVDSPKEILPIVLSNNN